MIQSTVLFLALCAGTLVEPFRIAEAEPGHHQGCLRAAMATDGHFAVAWLDSLQPLGASRELDLYIRFFDPDGSPLTDPYKITKVVDTNLICSSHLDMDSAGNTVLLWTEYARMEPNDVLLRLQLFDTSGSPLGSPQTDHQGYISPGRAIGVSLNDQGGFAVAWDREGTICARRYSFDSGPQGDSFRVHDDRPDRVSCNYPGVALNDAGDLVVTWHEFRFPPNATSYPRFQVFDAEDEPILGWEPMGHRLDDGEEFYAATRAETFWLDDDRFVVFWIDKTSPKHIVGRVFTDRGLTRHPLRRLVRDSLATTWVDPAGRFAVAMSSDERFAETHTRTHHDPDDYWRLNWQHQAGVLGKIVANEPWRRTTLFEYSHPWGKDTLGYDVAGGHRFQFPAVGVCEDRIVWVYSRFNPDTIFEAFAIITDWNMGVGVVEQPIVEKPPNWEVVTSIGPQIVLRYHDRPDGFRASIFDATGRKVDELHSDLTQDAIEWGEDHNPGVYFIVPEGSEAPSQKVVLIR